MTEVFFLCVREKVPGLGNLHFLLPQKLKDMDCHSSGLLILQQLPQSPPDTPQGTTWQPHGCCALGK